MINIRMRVSTSDGPQGEFAISPKVQVEFERQYKTGIGKAFENDLKMEHIYWLGWKAMHYAGRVVKPFDTWLDEIVEIEVVNESTGPLDETA
jgi:hypothetical protein